MGGENLDEESSVNKDMEVKGSLNWVQVNSPVRLE